MSFFDNLAYKFGYLPKRDWVLKSLPEQTRRKIENMERTADPTTFFQMGREAGKEIESMDKLHPQIRDQAKSFIIRGSSDLFGYRPSGARIWNYFANPFGVFGYIAENHAAAKICVGMILADMENDGFLLRGAEGVSTNELLEVYKIIKELKIDDLRLEVASHLKFYGNAWLYPHENFLHGVTDLELMYPGRVLPIFNRTDESIVGWEYIIGRIRRLYEKNELLHLKLLSPQGKELGSPPLVPAVMDIEATFHASAFNNMIFQKGGLIAYLVALKDPESSNDPMSASVPSDWEDQLQARFDGQFAGAKGAGGLLFSKYIQDVHKLTEMGKFDASYLDGMDHTSKTVAYLLGTPSEKMGINRSSNLQYQAALIEDMLNAQYNKTINEICQKVDTFFNRQVLQGKLGITNIKMQSSGRYGAMTKAASETIKNLADTGLIITVNEARERILGWEPLPADDERGKMILDNSLNRDPESLPLLIGEEHPDPDLEVLKTYDGNIGRFFSSKSNTIHVGGIKDGIIHKKD